MFSRVFTNLYLTTVQKHLGGGGIKTLPNKNICIINSENACFLEPHFKLAHTGSYKNCIYCYNNIKTQPDLRKTGCKEYDYKNTCDSDTPPFSKFRLKFPTSTQAFDLSTQTRDGEKDNLPYIPTNDQILAVGEEGSAQALDQT